MLFKSGILHYHPNRDRNTNNNIVELWISVINLWVIQFISLLLIFTFSALNSIVVRLQIISIENLDFMILQPLKIQGYISMFMMVFMAHQII